MGRTVDHNSISPGSTAALAEVAIAIRGVVLKALRARIQPITDTYEQLRVTLGSDLTFEQFADAYAQMLVGGLMLVRTGESLPGVTSSVVRKLVTSEHLCRMILGSDFPQIMGDSDCDSPRESVINIPEYISPDLVFAILQVLEGDAANRSVEQSEGDFFTSFVGLYESFLAKYDSGARKRRGVYYTPQPVVRFIVRSVDEVVRSHFLLDDGLADTSRWADVVNRSPSENDVGTQTGQEAFIRVLDPAAGTGVFLLAVIDLIHEICSSKWQRRGMTVAEMTAQWNRYVQQVLLARLTGYEVMLASAAIANSLIRLKLAQTNFYYSESVPCIVRVHNPLMGPFETDLPHVPPDNLGVVTESTSVDRSDSLRSGRKLARATVVLGNPPFSGISSNKGTWIDGLLKGVLPDGQQVAGYYHVDGQRLAERKHWLQDDYVKFFRYAQWRIEESGCGVVGFVTNHGYVDNPTFRGMRQCLLNTFTDLFVIDLHGNRKKHEQTPSGMLDENVFAIEQGVAVGIFARLPGRQSAGTITHAELWGREGDKFRELNRNTVLNLTSEKVEPSLPNYYFFPHDNTLRGEYERGFRLSDIMPIHSTAIVTARDRFVIDINKEDLVARMARFRDAKIDDAEIRSQYFTRTRSTKYPAGDTRGWKLHDARLRAAADADWRSRLKLCQYRPFDERWIYWADWMIDWPREEVSRNLLDTPNIALIARRQMLRSQVCNFFWVSDLIPVDGIIRSDNRGSESVFPLYTCSTDNGRKQVRQANFTDQFVTAVCRSVGWRWLPTGSGDLRATVGPEDIFHYCYAMFFAESYRGRYADLLRTDFPRVFLTSNAGLMRRLCQLGQRLSSMHRLQNVTPDLELFKMTGEKADVQVGRGYPRHVGLDVHVSKTHYFSGVSASIWNYRVGAHQVCRKWLRDRRGRKLNDADIIRYRTILAAIAGTLEHAVQIDDAILEHGGWPNAFDYRRLS